MVFHTCILLFKQKRYKFSTFVPGSHLLTAKLKIFKPTSLALPREKSLAMTNAKEHVTPQVCNSFVPDSILRMMPRLDAEELAASKSRIRQKIQLVDGTTIDLSPKTFKPARPLHEEQRADIKVNVRQLQLKERFYNHVLHFFYKVDEPYLRLPIWRITQVFQGPDQQHLMVRWTIDRPEDAQVHRETLELAFTKVASKLRHFLAIHMNLRSTPTIVFEHEDYSATSLVESLNVRDQCAKDS